MLLQSLLLVAILCQQAHAAPSLHASSTENCRRLSTLTNDVRHASHSYSASFHIDQLMQDGIIPDVWLCLTYSSSSWNAIHTSLSEHVVLEDSQDIMVSDLLSNIFDKRGIVGRDTYYVCKNDDSQCFSYNQPCSDNSFDCYKPCEDGSYRCYKPCLDGGYACYPASTQSTPGQTRRMTKRNNTDEYPKSELKGQKETWSSSWAASWGKWAGAFNKTQVNAEHTVNDFDLPSSSEDVNASSAIPVAVSEDKTTTTDDNVTTMETPEPTSSTDDVSETPGPTPSIDDVSETPGPTPSIDVSETTTSDILPTSDGSVLEMTSVATPAASSAAAPAASSAAAPAASSAATLGMASDEVSSFGTGTDFASDGWKEELQDVWFDSVGTSENWVRHQGYKVKPSNSKSVESHEKRDGEIWTKGTEYVNTTWHSKGNLTTATLAHRNDTYYEREITDEFWNEQMTNKGAHITAGKTDTKLLNEHNVTEVKSEHTKTRRDMFDEVWFTNSEDSFSNADVYFNSTLHTLEHKTIHDETAGDHDQKPDDHDQKPDEKQEDHDQEFADHSSNSTLSRRDVPKGYLAKTEMDAATKANSDTAWKFSKEKMKGKKGAKVDAHGQYGTYANTIISAKIGDKETLKAVGTSFEDGRQYGELSLEYPSQREQQYFTKGEFKKAPKEEVKEPEEEEVKEPKETEEVGIKKISEEPKEEEREEPKQEELKQEELEEPKEEERSEPKAEELEKPKAEELGEPKAEELEKPKAEELEELRTPYGRYESYRYGYRQKPEGEAEFAPKRVEEFAPKREEPKETEEVEIKKASEEPREEELEKPKAEELEKPKAEELEKPKEEELEKPKEEELKKPKVEERKELKPEKLEVYKTPYGLYEGYDYGYPPEREGEFAPRREEREETEEPKEEELEEPKAEELEKPKVEERKEFKPEELEKPKTPYGLYESKSYGYRQRPEREEEFAPRREERKETEEVEIKKATEEPKEEERREPKAEELEKQKAEELEKPKAEELEKPEVEERKEPKKEELEKPKEEKSPKHTDLSKEGWKSFEVAFRTVYPDDHQKEKENKEHRETEEIELKQTEEEPKKEKFEKPKKVEREEPKEEREEPKVSEETEEVELKETSEEPKGKEESEDFSEYWPVPYPHKFGKTSSKADPDFGFSGLLKRLVDDKNSDLDQELDTGMYSSEPIKRDLGKPEEPKKSEQHKKKGNEGKAAKCRHLLSYLKGKKGAYEHYLKKSVMRGQKLEHPSKKEFEELMAHKHEFDNHCGYVHYSKRSSTSIKTAKYDARNVDAKVSRVGNAPRNYKRDGQDDERGEDVSVYKSRPRYPVAHSNAHVSTWDRGYEASRVSYTEDRFSNKARKGRPYSAEKSQKRSLFLRRRQL